MPSRLRAILGAGLVGSLLATAAVPAVAGEREDWEPVTLKLTLSGEVDPADTFWFYHRCLDGDERPECIFIHSVTPQCTSEEWGPDWLLEPCEARTYRVQFRQAAGIDLEYGIEFMDGPSGRRESLLENRVTVPEGGITLHMTFDYSLRSAPPADPALPDTAIPAPLNP